jgi:hypothetical protein
MRRLLHREAAVAVALLPAPLFAATFDQGAVTTRPYRNQELAAAQAHPVETENLFGFTLGSDVDEAGTFGIALESIGAFGKNEGRYRAATSKLELSYAPVNNLSVSLSLLGGAWDINNNPDLPNTYAWRFRGIGGEMRWRLLERGPERFGVTLHVEPSIAMFDEAAGQAGSSYASENKLIVDTVLVHDRVWAAMNLVYDVESFRPWAGGLTEEASVTGITGAVTARVFNSFFLGAEMCQLYAFNGLTFGSQVGQALYLGPTAYWRISNSAWLTAAWNIQVAGHANNDPRRLDLTNFSRHAVRLKIGVEF